MRQIPILLLFMLSACFSYSQNRQATNADSSKPFVLGVINQLYSSELSETRILNIYLPEGYNPADSITYPVIYLLDGSADEDFIHVTGLVQFNTFPWIDRVPKSIVVGIANTDRKRDFTFPTTIAEDKTKYPTTGHSDQFMNFIEKELQPYIEKKYKTNADRMIIGQSLGGLLAAEILLKRPNLFNRYVIISPSIWWDNGSLLNFSSRIEKDNFVTETSVYIGVGKEGATPGPNPRVMEDDARLLAQKLKRSKSKSVTVDFDFLPQENHATIGHQAVFNALRLLYPVNKKK
jgi:predicted alpha/beta superfamily hydrolase